MSWPTEKTPPFYVHDRQCSHCGKDFKGFARSRYCSPECHEMSYRAKMMRRWGVPDDVVQSLCGATHE